MATISGIHEQLLIGGEWRESAGEERFDVTNPATGEVVGSVPDGTPEDATAAIDAASAALPAWRDVPAIERGRLLRRAADLIRERKDELGRLITTEQGKPLAEAVGEVVYAAGFFDWFAGEAERIYGQVVPPQAAGKRMLVLRQGVGVTAAITPWNFPAAMLTRKLGPAIAAGCTSVVKPAESTPLTAIAICRALEDAGAPPGLVNLVTTLDPAAFAGVLMSDARVRKLSFTGSTEVGKELIRGSADQVKRLSLELGGQAPFLVFDDADLDASVEALIASKFRNAGQTCVCANRVYVQRGIHDRFLEAFTKRVTQLVVGRGLEEGVQIGPLIDEAAIEKAQRHVDDAVSGGAALVLGGKRLGGDGFDSGTFFEPTVIDGVTSSMLLAQEETFGPIAGLTVFDTEDEAVESANDTPFGLAAYVQTRDYARLLRVVERLDYGIVGANDGLPANPAGPFGGFKESGYGREGGAFGIDEYLEVKYVSIGGVDS